MPFDSAPETTLQPTTRLLLKSARDRIATLGWAKYASSNGTSACTVFAIDQACIDVHGVTTNAYKEAIEALGNAVPSHVRANYRPGGYDDIRHLLVYNNDYPTTTKDDILALFDRALAD